MVLDAHHALLHALLLLLHLFHKVKELLRGIPRGSGAAIESLDDDVKKHILHLALTRRAEFKTLGRCGRLSKRWKILSKEEPLAKTVGALRSLVAPPMVVSSDTWGPLLGASTTPGLRGFRPLDRCQKPYPQQDAAEWYAAVGIPLN